MNSYPYVLPSELTLIRSQLLAVSRPTSTARTRNGEYFSIDIVRLPNALLYTSGIVLLKDLPVTVVLGTSEQNEAVKRGYLTRYMYKLGKLVQRDRYKLSASGSSDGLKTRWPRSVVALELAIIKLRKRVREIKDELP
jgi:hypothetical protein